MQNDHWWIVPAADLHATLRHQKTHIAPRQSEFGQALERNKGKDGHREGIWRGQSVLEGSNHGVQQVMGRNGARAAASDVQVSCEAKTPGRLMST